MNKTLIVLLLVLLTTTVILCDQAPAEKPKETPSTALAPVDAPAQTLEADTLKHHHHHHAKKHHHHHAKKHHVHHHGRKPHHHHRRHHHVRKIHVRKHHVRRHHPIRRHHVRRHHVHHKRHHVRRHHIRRHRIHHKKHHIRRHHPIRRHHVRRHHIHHKIHHIKPARKVFHVRHHHHRKPVSRRQHKRLVRKIRKISHRVRKVQMKKSRKFEIVRKTFALPKMSKIQLHNSTPTYTDSVAGIPKNARALLIGVYYLHGNYPQGHGYLNFEMSQKGADAAKGVAKMTNYHHNWYFNSDYYEFMLPWSGKLTQEVVMKVTSSYNTGSYPNSGNQNYYKLSVEGYLLH